MPIDFQMKTLVIDDMPTMVKIVMRMLEKIGFKNLDKASDGAEGWKKIVEAHKAGEPFQFIVSDWNMPNMSGLELLKKIRATEALKGLPFLMVTAESEKDQVIAAITAGVTNYVSKPFTPQTMFEKISKIFP